MSQLKKIVFTLWLVAIMFAAKSTVFATTYPDGCGYDHSDACDNGHTLDWYSCHFFNAEGETSCADMVAVCSGLGYSDWFDCWDEGGDPPNEGYCWQAVSTGC